MHNNLWSRLPFLTLVILTALASGCDEGKSNSNSGPAGTCLNDGNLCSLSGSNQGICISDTCGTCTVDNPCPGNYDCNAEGFCIANNTVNPITDDPETLACIEQSSCNRICRDVRSDCLRAACDAASLDQNTIAIDSYYGQCIEDCQSSTNIAETYCKAPSQDNICPSFESYFSEQEIDDLRNFCEPENPPTPTPFDACDDNNIISVRTEDFVENVAVFDIDTNTKENALRANCTRSENAVVFKLDFNSGNSGEFRIETTNIFYDTVLTVHTGACGQVPDGAACNDNIEEDRYASRLDSINLDIVSNSYFVTVYGKREARGTAKLRIERLVDPCADIENFNCRDACEAAFSCVGGYCQTSNQFPKEDFVNSKVTECTQACNTGDTSTRSLLCTNHQVLQEDQALQCRGYVNGLRLSYELNTNNYCTNADPQCLANLDCNARCDEDTECLRDYCTDADRTSNEQALTDARRTCRNECNELNPETINRFCGQNACNDLISSTERVEENYCGILIVDERCGGEELCSGTDQYTFECLENYCEAQGRGVTRANPLVAQILTRDVLNVCNAEVEENLDRFNALCRNHPCNNLLGLIEVGEQEDHPDSIASLDELCTEGRTVELSCGFDPEDEEAPAAGSTPTVDCQAFLFEVRRLASISCGRRPHERSIDEALWQSFETDFLEQCSTEGSVFQQRYCVRFVNSEGNEADYTHMVREAYLSPTGILPSYSNTYLFLCPDPENPDIDPDGFVCRENTRISCDSTFFNGNFSQMKRFAWNYCSSMEIPQALDENTYDTFVPLQLEQCLTNGSQFQTNYCAALPPERNQLSPYSAEGQNVLFGGSEFCVEADFSCEVAEEEGEGEASIYTYRCEKIFEENLDECARADCGEIEGEFNQEAYDLLLNTNRNRCEASDAEFIRDYCEVVSNIRAFEPMCFEDNYEESFINVLVGGRDQYCVDPNVPAASCLDFLVQEIEAPGRYEFDTTGIENDITTTCNLDSSNAVVFTFSENFPPGPYNITTSANFDTVLSARYDSCESIANQPPNNCHDDINPENNPNSLLSGIIDTPEEFFILVHGADGRTGQGILFIERVEEEPAEE